MINAISRALSLGLAAGLIALVPGHAMAGSTYSATLAAPLASPKQDIVNGVLWKCTGDRCTAPDQGSRPALVCQKVAKHFGEVAAFTSPGVALTGEALAKCNGK